MQNPTPKLRQTSIISKKPGFLSKKLKTDELQLPQSLIFFTEILHTFYPIHRFVDIGK